MSRLDRECSVTGCENKVWSRDMCRKHYARWRTHGDPGIVLLKQSPAGSPLAFVRAIPLTGNECVTWPFATNGAGYAQIYMSGRKKLVSRVVCEAVNGPPPTLGHVAAHECGKGHQACVAPWHLKWKTPAENTADMYDHGTASYGEKHSKKLTQNDVYAIRDLAETQAQSEIAHHFGISQTAVSKIIRRKIWARGC